MKTLFFDKCTGITQFFGILPKYWEVIEKKKNYFIKLQRESICNEQKRLNIIFTHSLLTDTRFEKKI